MVMDQVFGQLGCLHLDQEPELSYIIHAKDHIGEISMDLDDFKFDFDSLSDNLGPWIQPNDLKINTEDTEDSYDLKSESTDFEDLNITEAVRYDCMWSSNPSLHTAKHNDKPIQPLCENSLLEEFLKIIDIPSQFDLDIDIKAEPDILKETKVEVPSPCDSKLTDLESQVRMFTSLDHCYVSTTSPRPDKHSTSSNFLDTPPESSEDEETQMSSTFQSVVVNPPSSSSLLRSRTVGEPKFCFRVKLKSDKSRSVLKPNLVSSAALNKTGMMNKTMVHTSVRRRKEESLQVKHLEAREIHNHMERQRRNELKVAFDDLKACIPHIARSEKVSKQMILDTALENCKIFKSREISLRLRKEKLKKSNAELRQRLKDIQNGNSA